MSDVDPQPEPELERWLSEAREVEGERADPEALDGMLESVEREIARRAETTLKRARGVAKCGMVH